MPSRKGRRRGKEAAEHQMKKGERGSCGASLIGARQGAARWKKTRMSRNDRKQLRENDPGVVVGRR